MPAVADEPESPPVATDGRMLEAALPSALGFATFVFFALLSPPSFYWLDSAELSAAGVGLGSPHPTGFPLYMMLVKAASLVPVGELAFRVNLLSAACAALCIALVARLVLGVSARQTTDLARLAGATLAALSLASGLLFARHACVAEVYVPTAAALAAVFLALDRVARGGGARAGLMLAVVCGLGLGLHSSFRFLVPIPVAVILWRRLRRGARWPLYAPLLALGIGAALQLYMPVRSASGRIAALDWGHPRSFAATWDQLSGARIRDAFASDIASRTQEVVSVNVAEFAGAVFDGLGPFVILLALFGVGALLWRRRSRTLGAALVLAAALDFVYSFWINPMGLVDGQNGTALAVAATIAAGFGAVRFLERSGRATPYVGAVVALIAAAMPMAVTWSALSAAARAPTPRQLCDAGLDQLEPRGIALTQSDSMSAGLLFLTTVEGARPDVAVLVRQHLRDLERVEAVLGLSRAATVFIDRELDNPGLAAVFATRRPLYWEIGDDGLPGATRVTATVPLATLSPLAGKANPIGDIEAAEAELRRLWRGGMGDPLSRRVLAVHLSQLGRLAFVRGKIDRAAELFDAALAVRPRHAVALVNRGVVHSRRGEYELALLSTRRALAVEPNRVAALINAARYARELGDLGSARRYIKRAIALEPGNQPARALADEM